MDLLAAACAFGQRDGRSAGAWHRRFASRLGIACDYAGIADRNVAPDGARFSSRDAERAAGKSGSSAAHWNCGAAGISDAGLRTHFTYSREITGGASDVGGDPAGAHRAVVRAVFPMEL